MELSNYLFVAIVSYLGLMIGYVLIYFAQEEKKPGMEYFQVLDYFVFFIFALVSIILNIKNWPIVLLFSAAFFIKKYRTHISYLFFAIMIALSKVKTELMTYSIITFAYGLIMGSILFDPENKKRSFLELFHFIYFPLIIILIRLIL
jgi:hypothetical protein